jgi:S1-C subfamily serine protease
VLDSQGRILTNAHVVSNARQLRVTFHDGETVGAQVVGVDASDDLAVIQVSVSAGKLHPLPLGDSDAVRVGDMALAIGSPFGLQGTLTAGIVSGVDRTKTAPTGRALRGMIQTDAAINPGNSGGPLLNRAGEVIGIDESIESPVEGSVGVGFAIPINTAKRVLPELQRGQAIQYPWLGIRGQAITPSQVDALGLQEKTGVLVIEVIANGPAARAGLHADGQPSASNDIVMAVDGRSIASLEALTAYLDGKHVGDKVTLQVSRQGKRLSLEATLAAFPAP